MTTWQLNISLDEPFCCASKPLEGNETPTTPFIPATTLRGAFATSLVLQGKGGLRASWFGLQGPFWRPAWPGSDGQHIVIPRPLCYALDKAGRKPGTSSLLKAAVPRHDDGTEVQWQPAKDRFREVDEQGSLQGIADQGFTTLMHVGLSYDRQASRETALYSRSEVEPGSHFVTWIEDPTDVLDQESLQQPLFLGKRRSAGSGRARVTAVQGIEPAWKQLCSTRPDASGTATLQMMTDAIAMSEDGSYWRGFSGPMLAPLLGVDAASIEVKRVWAEAGLAMGWSSAWKLPREQAVAIRAGSVCEFAFNASVAEGLRQAALEKLDRGIGIRQREGFGVVAVNPRWLDKDDPFRPDETVASSQLARDERSGWISKAVEIARKAAGSRPLENKVKTLSSYSLRLTGSDQGQVTRFLQHMGARANSRGWGEAKDTLLVPLDKCRSLEEAQFILSVAATLLEQPEENDHA